MQHSASSDEVSPSSHFVPSNTRGTPLNRSLHGILLPDVDDSQVYAVVNTYVSKSWQDFDPTLALKLGTNELKRIGSWAQQFHSKFTALLDDSTIEGKGGTIHPATTENIRGLLAQLEHRQAATLLYVSGHTDLANEKLVYLTSNSLQNGTISSDMALSYSEIGSQLRSQASSKPLIWVTEWVTEACGCDNFMQLPYEYWCDGDEVKCKETGFKWSLGEARMLQFAATAPGQSAATFERSSGALQFAATAPGQSAATFERSSGAVYTQALCNVELDKCLSLGDIVKKIQHNMNYLLGKTHHQEHRGEEDFFDALGFSVKTSDCQVA
ncbi:unnamed protein product [Rhizoctonia solani]|uniref:Peptidase C14 caspase domain-containing protein n=1 Tax=Rhizoctonia solani TaxID=456999 RepID=A0A8H3CW83_9AGAM|nr:unnamed protein product [Rhizoctonia solani]